MKMTDFIERLGYKPDHYKEGDCIIHPLEDGISIKVDIWSGERFLVYEPNYEPIIEIKIPEDVVKVKTIIGVIKRYKKLWN